MLMGTGVACTISNEVKPGRERKKKKSRVLFISVKKEDKQGGIKYILLIFLLLGLTTYE